MKTTVWSQAIRRQLREHGLTQAELARRAGVSRSTLVHVLRGGHCTTETIERLAAALGLTVVDFLEEPIDLGLRRDKMVAAVLRELSDTVSEAVQEHLARRRREGNRRRRGEVRLPFPE